MTTHIKVEINAFKSALKELKGIDKLATEKADVGYSGKYSVRDSFALTIACMVSASIQDLIGYLNEEDMKELGYV